MRKLRTFLYVLKKSASEPTYYIHVLRAKFSFSLAFFLSLLLILSVIDVAILRLRDIPQFIQDADKETSHAVNALPDSFQSAYTQGKLTITKATLPVTIPSGDSAKRRGLGDDLVELTSEEKESKRAFFTLTPTRLIVRGTTDIPIAVQEMPYRELFDASWTLDKKQIMQKRDALIAALPDTANILSLLLIPLWFVGLVLGTTFMLLFLSLLVNTFGWVIGVRLPLIKTLQLGLHAIGVATLIDVAKFALFPDAHVSLVVPGYLGIMGLVFWTLREVKHNGKQS